VTSLATRRFWHHFDALRVTSSSWPPRTADWGVAIHSTLLYTSADCRAAQIGTQCGWVITTVRSEGSVEISSPGSGSAAMRSTIGSSHPDSTRHGHIPAGREWNGGRGVGRRGRAQAELSGPEVQNTCRRGTRLQSGHAACSAHNLANFIEHRCLRLHMRNGGGELYGQNDDG